MMLIAATFVLVLLIVAGSYWLFVVHPEHREQAVLQKRMQPEDPAKRTRLLMPKSERSDSAGSPLGGMQKLLDQSGMKLTVPALLFLCWMSGLLLGLGVYMGSRQPIIAGVAGVLGMFAPYLWLKHAASKRMWKFEEQFPEAIDLIARALRAGHAFPTGLQMVADELAAPVGPEFKLLYDRQNYGMPLADALRAFARRVPILDARFFVTAVLTQREAGGNLSGVLDNLSSVIRERFKVKRQVRVVSAHGRMTAAILMALPPFVCVAQAAIAPANVQSLLTHPLGVKMLISAGVLQVIGMFAISRLVKVEY